jgi:glycosyltransferase involved in cell wall biosynthesis
MLRRAALLLAQTAHEAELYQDFGGRSETIRLLPLPLSPIDLDLQSIRGSFRAKIGVDDDERLLLFLGRINRLKGLDVLIESVQPLLGDGTSLAVVGRDDGQLAEIASRFGELIADGRVRLTGPLYDDDRFAAYVDADVFCLTPPHWEETSVATLEAAACGTAVVVSEQADLPGLAAAGGGFVVPLDRRSISGAVSAALSDSAAIGARARSHVLAQHDRDGVVARLDGLLRSLI